MDSNPPMYVYIYKFSPRDFSENVYKYIHGQTAEGPRKFARVAHILRPSVEGTETDHYTRSLPYSL